MKKIIFLLLGIALFASCQKEDDNGDLGGNWKLTQIEDFATDSIIDKRMEDRFWAIQLDLIQIGNGKGRFQHVNDSLFVQMIRKTDALGKRAGGFRRKHVLINAFISDRAVGVEDITVNFGADRLQKRLSELSMINRSFHIFTSFARI